MAFRFIATPKPSQSSKFSLGALLSVLSLPPQPPAPPPILFEPGAFKSGQGLPRQLGTSNVISRTLAKLKALGFQIWISDFRFQISDFGFQL